MAEPWQLPRDVSFVSFNICWSRWATGTHEEFSLLARIHKVVMYLRDAKADIMFLQEVPPEYESMFEAEFTKYSWSWKQQPDQDGRCSLAIATKLHLKIIPDMGIGSNLAGLSLPDTALVIISNGFCLANVHFQMDKRHRGMDQKRLATALRTAFVPPIEPYTIVWGSMNTFADEGGRAELADFARTSGLRHVCGEGPRSFVPYPYDADFDAGDDSIPIDNGFLSANLAPFKSAAGDILPAVFVGDMYPPKYSFRDATGRTWWCSDHFATEAKFLLK